jgi:hypothetical protein
MKRMLTCVVLTLTLGACGADDSTGPSEPPYTQTVTGTVTTFGSTVHAFTIPRSGTLSLTLSWSDVGVDLDLYLAPSSCTSLYPISNCGVLASSNGASATRELITRPVVAGQTFSVWVDNLSPSRSMNYTLNVLID